MNPLNEPKTLRCVVAAAMTIALSGPVVLAGGPAGTAVTYQGLLKDGGSNVDGLTTFEFRLFDAEVAGTQVGLTAMTAETVTEGLFTAILDFGVDPYTSSAPLWIEVTVEGEVLSRQEITAAPFSLATRGINVDANDNIGIGTTTPATMLDVSGTVTASAFIGDGSGLTDLPVPGINNTVSSAISTCSGGENNAASDSYSTVGGGEHNTASSTYCTVGGGFANTASDFYATVSGGDNNEATEIYCTVGGGAGNTAVHEYSTVGGGWLNTASGTHSTIPGGAWNSAGGAYSFAAGRTAKVRDASESGDSDGDEGTFVWADSTFAEFSSTGPNQFLISAGGGVGIGTNTPATALDVAGTVTATAFVGDGSGLTNLPADPDMWTESGSDIHYNAGKVGIGTSVPQVKLDVAGSMNVDAGTLFVDSVNNAVGIGAINTAKALTLRGTMSWPMEITSTGHAGINMDSDGTASSWAIYHDVGTDNLNIRDSTTGANRIVVDGFSGAVTVPGILAKGGGSFRIDHPLDPENKELHHSFVESPDMMNIYNGNVVTDAAGYATVTLPDYFEALNREFRYQLTVIDNADSADFVMAKVVQRIAGNAFTVRTSMPSTEVSWQVTGVRQDPWAEANRIPNVVEKRSEDKGTYLHHEAWGQPAEKGLFSKDSVEVRTDDSRAGQEKVSTTTASLPASLD
jgi:hypothetical protein